MIVYAEDIFDSIESKQDNCPPHGQGKDGYGRKISMPYLVRLNGFGRWYRVYCTCISNIGSLWVVVDKVVYHFRQDENLRIKGLWPKETRNN